jgi:uncharacterized protein
MGRYSLGYNSTNEIRSPGEFMPLAVITGASGGIGLELARVFAREGFDLALVARTGGALEQIAQEITAQFGRKVQVVVEDLSATGAPARVYQATGDAGVLVNNAGFGLNGKFVELDAAQQLNMIELNVTALTALTRLYLPAMVKAKSGRILNVASTAAFQAGPLMTIYYASKAYVLSFTEGIAEELQGTGVTATALCPGPVITGFQERSGLEGAKLLKSPMVMTAAAVAEYGYTATMNGKVIAIAGAGNRLMAWSTKFAPRAMTRKIARSLQETKS